MLRGQSGITGPTYAEPMMTLKLHPALIGFMLGTWSLGVHAQAPDFSRAPIKPKAAPASADRLKRLPQVRPKKRDIIQRGPRARGKAKTRVITLASINTKAKAGARGKKAKTYKATDRVPVANHTGKGKAKTITVKQYIAQPMRYRKARCGGL